MAGINETMKWAEVWLRGELFSVRIARSLGEKKKGLAGEDSLKRNEGMMFVFSFEWRHAFWMKNVGFPLDFIYLDKNMKIVEMIENQPPCRSFFCPVIIPKAKAKYVIEVNAGTAERLKLWIGDAVTVNFPE